jgi:xanthine dehydrogenase YagT iron-sulfur-binding subunit
VARRRFLRSSGLLTSGAAAATVFPAVARSQSAVDARRADTAPEKRTVATRLTVNDHAYDLQVEPRTTLLDAIREQIGLSGTKKGCDRGQCGACTVIVNGRRINSCLSLAVMHDGASVTTIEGLAPNAGLHPMQKAFIQRDGFQCGFCTPGQICSAVAMLKEVASGTVSAATADVRSVAPIDLNAAEIRERMSGNLCRCGAYAGIVAAIGDVSKRSG